MKTKISTFFVLVVFIFVQAFLYLPEQAKAANYDFYVAIGDVQTDVVQSMTQTSDGGYIIAGYSWSYGGADSDAILIKYDEQGDVEWTKVLGGTLLEEAVHVIQTSDGGYAFTGITSSNGGTDRDILVTKLNSSGIEQWSKYIGAAPNDYGQTIIETGGGYTVIGHSRSYGGGSDSDVIIIRLNSSGVEQWTSVIAGTSDELVYKAVPTSDGGYAIVGYTETWGGTDKDILIVKVTSTGVEQWTKTIGGSNDDEGWSIVQSTDGGYVITGYTKSYGGTDEDLILSKLNSSGVEQWTKIIDTAGTDWGFDLVQTSDGGYAVTGMASNVMGVTKFTSSGVEEWTKGVPGQGRGVVQTTDGGYAIGGNTWAYGAQPDLALLKLDSNGDLTGCGVLTTETVSETDVSLSEQDETAAEVSATVTEVDIVWAEQDITIDPTELYEECFYTYQSTTTDQSGIEVNIADVIALDCGADVDFGTVTPGTPVTAETTCTATTNAENGYTLQVKREDSDTTMDHTTDDTTNITDKADWTSGSPNATTAIDDVLGFGVYASTATKNTTWWGTGTACDDASNNYAGFPSAYDTIMTHSTYSATGTTTSVCYKVDLPSSQKSGSYDGVVTYQVYTNP